MTYQIGQIFTAPPPQPAFGAAECELGKARYALRTIAAMKTAKANATVRRMAAVAQEAVEP